MASELQQLVDSLGRQLGRSVAIDDPHIRLLAYNNHPGEVDEARITSIMQRSVSSERVAFIYESGAGTAADLFTVPVREDIGHTIARIGMPIRLRNNLLGFVWLLESDGPVTDQHAEALRRTAEAAATILYREHLLGELERSRERILLRQLLFDSTDARAEAAADLVREEFIVSGPVTALTVTIVRADGEPLEEDDRLALALGLEHARRLVAARHLIKLDRPNHGILIVSQRLPTPPDIADLAHAIQQKVITDSGRRAEECWIGIGGARESLDEVHGSYVEARRAAEVARVVGSQDPVAHYAHLGVYRLLAEIPTDRLGDFIHPGMHRLLNERNNGRDLLIETLEVFLDNGCDVKRTAARFCIHRASLYYRIRRIEAIAQVDLNSGEDRLNLHLGLRIARLARLLSLTCQSTAAGRPLAESERLSGRR